MSTLSKMEKVKNSVYFRPYDFVQISTACGQEDSYQVMHGETLDFRCQHQQW